MNTLLDLKLRIQDEVKEKAKLKKQLTDRNTMDQIKINPSDPNSSAQTHILNHIQILLEKRSRRQQVETVIQLAIGAKNSIEQKLDIITEERGMIQEKARTVSM